MKILIEMTPGQYDGMLGKISQDSPVYAILKNGVVEHPLENYAKIRVINIVCDMPEAEMLLNEAKEVWPDAALEIASSIRKKCTFN